MAKTPQRSHHAHPQPARRPDRDYDPPQAQQPAEEPPPTHRVDDKTPGVRDRARAQAQANPPTGAGQRDPNVEEPPPTQAELDQDREPLSPEEAEQLLRAGTRLRIKGDDPANWIAMSRHSGDLAVAYAATPEAIEFALSHELLVADA